MDRAFCPYCMTPVEAGAACAVCGLTAGTYTPAPHHLPPGTVLKDRYLVGRVLGEGGFGITYIGCDLQLELKVAIKEYFPTDKANRVAQSSLAVSSYSGSAGSRYEGGKKRFLQEARTMARMDKQPVIVGARDFFEANNTAYIVMEYVEGTTFKDLVAQRGGRIPVDELLRLIEPLFSALGAMHSAGLIHRDISPENLMLEQGTVRLLDFGCARESTDGNATLTIALKHGYAPIEQYQNKGQGPWTDVYALSATIYYCITGKKPPQAMDRLCEDELILPRKLGVALTEKQEKALLCGMGIRPKRRFQSVQELHAALYSKDDPAGSGPIGQSAAGEASAAPDVTGQDAAQDTAAIIRPSAQDTAVPGPLDPAPAPALSKRRLAWIGGGALLALLLLFALFPRTPASEAEAPEDEPPADVTYTDAEDAESLRALLEDGRAEGIRIPAECSIDLADGPLEVAKPLYIEEGAVLNLFQPLTVQDGGALTVAGSFYNQGLLRTVGGGTITVAGSGRLDGTALVWLEHKSDLVVEDGGSASMAGQSYDQAGRRFLALSETELFANATHVASFEAYQDAIRSDFTSAIVIDEDITLTNEDRAHRVPVLIGEGVTVTAPANNYEFLESGSWCVDGAILINRGTLLGAFQTGDWDDDAAADTCAVINYGTIDAEMHLDCGGSLVNLGTMNITSAQFILTDLYNLGTLTHMSDGPEPFLELGCQTAYNYGEFSVEGKGSSPEGVSHVDLGNGVLFGNCGVVRLGDNADWQIRSYLMNVGQFLVASPTAYLGNAGYIDSSYPTSVLDMHPDSTLGHAGLIRYGQDTSAVFPNNIDDGGGSLLTLSRNEPPSGRSTRQASTREELLSALADSGCTAVLLQGGVTVEGDLTVSKGLTINGALTLKDGSLTVTGEHSYLIGGSLDLGGGALTLDGNAVMADCQISSCGGLTIRDQAKLVNHDGLELAQGAAVELSGGNAHLIDLCGLELDQSPVRIGPGVFRSCVRLALYGCTVEIDGGELLVENSNLYLDSATTVTNGGSFHINGWSDQETELAGAINNSASMELNQWNLRLSGALTNTGRVLIAQDILVSGALENRGTVYTVYNAAIKTENGGTLTGSPAQPRSEWW